MKYPASSFRYVISAILLMAGCVASAQNNLDSYEKYKQDMSKRFEAYKEKSNKAFEGYRERMNKEFATYLEREWKNITFSELLPNPFKPEPEPIVDNNPTIDSRPLPHTPPVVITEPLPQPKPIEPIPTHPSDPVNILPDNENVTIPDEDIVDIPDSKPTVSKTQYVSFKFLGNLCQVRLPKTQEYSIPTASNSEMAKAWKTLSGEEFNDMLVDCLCLRKSLGLCDWAFYQLTLSLTGAYFGKSDINEAVAMQVYIMAQLGYKVRLARQGNQLYVLVAFAENLFATPFIVIGEDKFYCFFDGASDCSVEICDYQFPGEQSCTARMASIPAAPNNKTSVRTVKSKQYPIAVASVAVNKNLVDFYDKYPVCSWEIKAAASLSQGVKDQIYPSLRKAITNQTQAQAVNILLNFVQTGFEYETDDEQFGREKAFFGDETFYYPYCDCEDRSILFSILVRDLLGLDVVLLEYPSHIATAVKFTTNVTGDYFDIDGSKYIICDPTFIGAPIGKSMPDMLNLKANILKIN